MPELRQNFFTKEWVVIATERAKLREIATEYREMLNGKAPADAEDRPIAFSLRS